jgi:hypothetical protein
VKPTHWGFDPLFDSKACIESLNISPMYRVVVAWRFGEESIDHIPKALLPGVWRAEMKGKREWRNFRS